MLLDKESGALLLDFYGSLLTSHQINILEEYFNEDLSMNEIADNLSISKSAVSDLIKRSLNQLNEYENMLHLIENSNMIDNLILEMKNEKNELLNKYAEKLERLNRG